jgi:hypothetical protein
MISLRSFRINLCLSDQNTIVDLIRVSGILYPRRSQTFLTLTSWCWFEWTSRWCRWTLLPQQYFCRGRSITREENREVWYPGSRLEWRKQRPVPIQQIKFSTVTEKSIYSIDPQPESLMVFSIIIWIPWCSHLSLLITLRYCQISTTISVVLNPGCAWEIY